MSRISKVSGIPTVASRRSRSSSLPRPSLAGNNRGTLNVARPRSSSIGNRNSLISSRQSLAQCSSRLSETGRSAVRKDTRPLSDKNYQKKCIRKIFDFLQENNYSYPINFNVLSSPSSKDFYRIFQFIFDSNENEFLGPNVVDDIFICVKTMHYPFVINKSHLLNPGSRQSWSHLLGLLTWMISANEYRKTYEAHLYTDQDLDYSNLHAGASMETTYFPKKLFFKYVPLAFVRENKDSGSSECNEANLREIMIRINNVNPEYIEESKQKRHDLRKENAAADAELARLMEMENALEQTRRDKAIIAQYNEDLRAHIARKAEHLKTLSKETKNSKLKLEKAVEESDLFESKHEEQRLKGTNIALIQKQKKDLSEKLEIARKKRDESQQKVWNLQMHVYDSQKEFAKFCDQFEEMQVKTIKLLQENKELFEDFPDDLVLNKISNINVRGNQSPSVLTNKLQQFNETLAELKTFIVERTWAIDTARQNATQTVSELEMQNSVSNYEFESLSKTLENEKTNRQKLKTHQSSKLYTVQQSVIATQFELNKCSSTGPLIFDRADVAELKESLQLEKEEFEKCQERLNNEVETTNRTSRMEIEKHIQNTETLFNEFSTTVASMLARAPKKYSSKAPESKK